MATDDNRYLSLLLTIISTIAGILILPTLLVLFNMYIQPEYGISVETTEYYIKSLDPMISLFEHIDENHFQSNTRSALLFALLICIVIRVRYYLLLLIALLISGTIYNLSHNVAGMSMVVTGLSGFATVLYSFILIKIIQYRFKSNVNIVKKLINSSSIVNMNINKSLLDKLDSIIFSSIIFIGINCLYIMNKQIFADIIITFTSANIENPGLASLFMNFNILPVHYTTLSSEAHTYGFLIGSFFGIGILFYKYYILRYGNS